MSSLNPFATLIALAERCQETGLELPDNKNTQSLWVGLGFRLLGSQFVVSMGEVSELMLVPPATRLLGVKHFVTGVANVRGRLMAIIDLAVFFGGERPKERSQRRVFVVGEGDQYFGFIVDESLGMQHFPPDTFQTTVEAEEMFGSFVKGGYMVGGTPWPLLSLASLAADPKLETLAR